MHFVLKAASMLLVLVTIPVLAQDAGSGNEFGAVDSKFGTVRSSNAVFIGGRGGWIFGGTYAVGIGGYLLVNDVPARVPDTAGNHRLMASYGGLDLEYVYPLSSSLHLTFQTLIGGGAVGHTEDHYRNPRQHYDPFFVLEPAINAYVTLSKIFSLGLGISYRLVGWLSSTAATNADLSSLSLNVAVKAASF